MQCWAKQAHSKLFMSQVETVIYSQATVNLLPWAYALSPTLRFAGGWKRDCTFSWFAPRAVLGRMETISFCVMQKELVHLRVSVIHLTHNPISVSSQSLSDVSTKFLSFNFPYL